MSEKDGYVRTFRLTNAPDHPPARRAALRHGGAESGARNIRGIVRDPLSSRVERRIRGQELRWWSYLGFCCQKPRREWGLPEREEVASRHENRNSAKVSIDQRIKIDAFFVWPLPHPARSEPCFPEQEAGNEPVREWLRDLLLTDKKVIGADILAVQWKWPVGKPLVDSLGGGLWEVRSSLGDRIARTFFVVVDEEIILFHGIIKKSRTAPKQELDLARKRQAGYMKEHRK